jgi:predicted 2-oxoglutarate/Fe(II)-dependent dioxygenase YbiX
MQAIRTAIHAYLTDLKLPWFTSWNGYSKIRFNKYEPNKEMALHYDCIHELFDGSVKGVPTLSIIGALNQDYTGGELIMFDDYEIKLNPGDIVIFPSTFLYPHRVKPVTAGCRYAFVSWVW